MYKQGGLSTDFKLHSLSLNTDESCSKYSDVRRRFDLAVGSNGCDIMVGNWYLIHKTITRHRKQVQSMTVLLKM